MHMNDDMNGDMNDMNGLMNDIIGHEWHDLTWITWFDMNNMIWHEWQDLTRFDMILAK
jgi:hypothetical protein